MHIRCSSLVECYPTRNVSFSPTNLHSICRNDLAAATRQVAEYHTPRRITTPVELEVPQIDPCTAPHALIDGKSCAAALMVHRVEGLFGAIWQGLIRNVYRIASCVWDVRRPLRRALFPLGNAFHCAIGALTKRILLSRITISEVGKAFTLPRAPGHLRVFLRVCRSVATPIIIDNDFYPLRVALTR